MRQLIFIITALVLLSATCNVNKNNKTMRNNSSEENTGTNSLIRSEEHTSELQSH